MHIVQSIPLICLRTPSIYSSIQMGDIPKSLINHFIDSLNSTGRFDGVKIWRLQGPIHVIGMLKSFIDPLCPLTLCYRVVPLVLASAFSNERLLTALNAVLGAGGSISIRQEARHREDLFPAVLHCFQGAAGRTSGRDLGTAKVILFPLRIGVPQVGRGIGIEAALEALGRSERRLIAARHSVPVVRRGGERPEGADAAVIQHADGRAVQVRWGKLVMEVEEGRRKVPVGESRRYSALAVVHRCKSV